jgi:hypothetical protein
MSIQSINHTSLAYTTGAASPAAQAIAGQTSQGGQTVKGADETQGGQNSKGGDGTIIAELKASLAAQGFSRDNTTMSKADYEKAMHAFTHAAFAAAHAQKQSDRVGSQGGTTDTSQAFSELADAAANGNVPADLQSAFDALQATQTSGAGGSATLAQVLAGMSQTGDGENYTRAGGLIDTQA